MSCNACQEFQDGEMTSYYRWTNATVEVRACREHLKAIYHALDEAQAAKITQPNQ